jgi:hypothetical protein
MARLELAEFVQPRAKVRECVRIAIDQKFVPLFAAKKRLVNHALYRTIRRAIIFEDFVQASDLADVPLVGDPHAPMFCGRAQVNQDSAWFEDSMDLPEGMNHAPSRDSSERPGKQGDVKLFFGEIQVFDSPYVEFNSTA